MTRSARTKFDLLLAPSADRLGKIGKKELVQAFQDEGIVDIETLVARIVEVAHESTERLSKELKPINLDLAARRTLPDIAKNTYHVAPAVPVIVDSIEYDPKDIGRFNGEALHFVLVNGHKDSKYLHALRDEAKPIIATYLYTRRVASIVTPLDWPPAPGWPPPPPVWGDGGRCGWMGAQDCLNRPDPPKPPPHTPGQIQMFDDTSRATGSGCRVAITGMT